MENVHVKNVEEIAEPRETVTNVKDGADKDVKNNSEVSDETSNKASNKDVPKMSLAKFFDIIGQIDIVLKSETSLRIVSQPYPFEEVRAGEWIMSTTDSLNMEFDVFVSGDDLRPWIITKFTQIKDYSNFDEYIHSCWELVLNRLNKALVVLKCPSSTIWTERQPDPNKLGYPLNLIIKSNAAVRRYAELIIGQIDTRDFSTTMIQMTVCGDKNILETGARLIEYSNNNMAQMRGILQRLIDLASANAKSVTILPSNSITTHFHPLADFRFCPLMYDGLPFYVRLAYALTVKAIAPLIPMEPINDSVIVKQSQGSTNRSSFLPDLVSTTYHPSMSADFAILLSTFLTPGYIQIEIDWSDVPSEASDMQCFIGLVCKLLFMHSGGVLDSITEDSARRVEERIAAVGIKTGFLRRSDNRPPGLYPLDNVDVVQRKFDNADLLGMRTDLTGNGWMNGNRQTRSNDGFEGIYETDIEPRPVYAVDCSSYDVFMDDQEVILGTWRTYRSLEGFARAWSGKNSVLGEAITLYGRHILKFIVRMNEYLRFNYYTGLRLPYHLVQQLIGQEKVAQCLRVPVKSKSIIAFVKSVGISADYRRAMPILQQIKVESQCVNSLMALRAFVNLLRDQCDYYQMSDEYGRQKQWSMALSAASIMSHSPLITHLQSLGDRKLLSAISRNYGIRVQISDLYRISYTMLIRSLHENTMRYGLLRDFFYRKNNFRTSTLEELRILAEDGNIQFNDVESYPDALPSIGPITVRGNLRGWLREVAAKYHLDIISRERFVEIRLPLRVIVDPNNPHFGQPFTISFRYIDANRRISDSVKFTTFTFGVLKLTSNEILNPDDVVDIASSLEMVCARRMDFDSILFTIEEFIAKLGDFTWRTMAFRDQGAQFISVLDPLS